MPPKTSNKNPTSVAAFSADWATPRQRAPAAQTCCCLRTALVACQIHNHGNLASRHRGLSWSRSPMCKHKYKANCKDKTEALPDQADTSRHTKTHPRLGEVTNLLACVRRRSGNDMCPCTAWSIEIWVVLHVPATQSFLAQLLGPLYQSQPDNPGSKGRSPNRRMVLSSHTGVPQLSRNVHSSPALATCSTATSFSTPEVNRRKRSAHRRRPPHANLPRVHGLATLTVSTRGATLTMKQAPSSRR